MFRYKRSVPVSYERQGYIYFKSRCYPSLPEKEKRRIKDLCMEVGGIYGQALFEFVTSGKSAASVCMRHHLSESTLARCVRKYYANFAD